MGFLRAGAVVVLLPLAAACGGGGNPASPGTNTGGGTAPPGGPAPTPGTQFVTGSVVSAIDDAAAPNASFTVNSTLVGLGGSNGTFNVGFPTQGQNRVSIAAAGFVTRETGISAPGSNVRVSLIPASFDLTAFDQMFRHDSVSKLTRWRTPPRLVLERRVVQFTDLCAQSYAATSEEIADGDANRILADTRDGYDILTSGRLGALAAVETQRTDVDAPVATRQAGRILLMRAKGLQSPQNNYWGYACWSLTADGEVTGGFIVVDRDFDLAVNPTHRQYHRSLWMHELGHTLGCQHVTARNSVMNSQARFEPNDFDRAAARLAMLRPIGNRSPDIDPTAHTASTLGARHTVTWHGAH